LNFNREDTITTIFCGSKKSLVHGMVFSKILFPVNAAVGMMILPLMLYHAIQLVVISMIAQRKSKEVE
jgi:sodium/bile acid cotransporter 7